MKRCLMILVAVAPLATAALDRPVRVESGLLEGVPALTAGVTAFKGIPYAAPPVGDLRWKAPQPPAAWPVLRNADRFGPACMQVYLGTGSTAFWGDYEFKSEDCLYVNVWTPAKSPNDKLPVMVWIHGGGFRMGSSSERLHHGDNLAMKGVLLVSFNYRLGAFGFLAHPELTKESGRNASGNYGLMDQVAALQWVKRNIAAFGGDPNRITIFGESAGSGSVSLMQATPLAKGLFTAAIGESGGNFSGRGVRQLAEAEQSGVAFAQSMGAKSLAELRAKPADEVLKAASRGAAAGPIVDGYVVPEDVYLIFAKGKQNDVPVLAGSNANEGTTLRAGQPTTLDNAADQAELTQLYPPDKEAEITSGGMLWTANIWARLEAKTGTKKTYEYYYSHRNPYPTNQTFSDDQGNVRDVSQIGAHHSAEIIYVFNNLDIRKGRDWPWQPWDYKLADMMSSYWTNFAKNGDPNGAGLPAWPIYSEASGQVMNFGESVQPIPLPRKIEVEFWNKVNLKPYANK